MVETKPCDLHPLEVRVKGIGGVGVVAEKEAYTVIPRHTSNRFTSFRLYEMHKLIPVFQFNQLSLIRAPSSRKPIVVPGASSRKLIFVNEFPPYEQFWRNELIS
jgi:hypothetical protein